MTREQLRQTIEGPAKVFGDQIEPALTNLLLNEMSPLPDEKGDIPDKLPVLQHVLMRMWTLAKAKNPKQVFLTVTDYEQIGGLTHALSQHADEAYTELANLKVPTESQKIAEILFRRLCERDPARRDTRSSVELSEVIELAGLPPGQQIDDVLNKFREKDRYFLMPPFEVDLKPDSIIDISHESLIQHWKRLKNWSEEEAESANTYRRLEDRACLWEAKRAELLSGIELEVALDWYKTEQPTVLWAKRYSKEERKSQEEGKYFKLAMRFLEKSEKEKIRKKQQEKEKKREQEEKEKLQAQQQLKWIQRVAIGTAIGLFIMAGLAIWGYVERNHALQQEQFAILQQQKAEQAELDSQLNNVAWLARFEDYQTAKTVLENIKKSHQNIPESRFDSYNSLTWFNTLMGGEAEYIYEGAEVPLSALAVHQKYLAVTGENGTLALFDRKSGQLLQRFQGHKGHVKTLVFHPQAHWLASTGYDKRIIMWSLATGKQIKEWQTSDKIWTLAVNPDGNYLASGGKDHDITLWEVKTGKPLHIFKGHEDDVKGLAFSSNGKWLASASDDGTVRLWNITTNQELYQLIGHTDKVYTLAFSQDDKWLASGSKDTTVRLWEVSSGKPKHLLLGHKKMVFEVAFSADGRYIVSASDDLTLRMWDTDSGITVRVLQGHTAGVNGVTISSEGKIYSVSDDTTIRRWSAVLPYQQAIDFAKKPISTAIAPNGNHVAVGFTDGTLRLYTLPKTKLLWEKPSVHADQVRRIAFSPDSSLIASASADKTAKLWQAKDGNLLQTVTGHTDIINAVAFSPPNGNILATASFGGQIGLFTLKTKQQNFFTAHNGKDVNTVSFNASGTQLLSTGDEEVRLWNLNSMPPTSSETYSKTTDLIWSALSPNGKQIASVGRDQLVHVYSTSDQYTTYRLKGHQNTIYRVIFSPSGQQLATVSSDATLRVWDLHNGMELFSLRLPSNSGKPVPLKDFDFRCIPEGGNCWIAVPLIRGKLMLYQLENLYDNAQ